MTHRRLFPAVTKVQVLGRQCRVRRLEGIGAVHQYIPPSAATRQPAQAGYVKKGKKVLHELNVGQLRVLLVVCGGRGGNDGEGAQPCKDVFMRGGIPTRIDPVGVRMVPALHNAVHGGQWL